MPPRGVKSAKRKRQYEHIAAATTNQTRAKKGETKSARKKSTSRRRTS